MLGNTLSDTHDERDLGVQSLLDSGSSQRRAIIISRMPLKDLDNRNIRDEDGGGSGASLLDGLRDILEDGKVEMRLAGLLGVCSTNNLGSYPASCQPQK
jgi:hypothetical protein